MTGAQDQLEDLRARNPLSRVFAEFGGVKFKGSGHVKWALSPFTAERTPSFKVDDNRGFFKCFSSGLGGDVFKAVMLLRRCGFAEAVSILGGARELSDQDRRQVVERQKTPAKASNTEPAVAIWSQAEEPRGTIVEHYLKNKRHLDLPAEIAGRVTRYHPACPWKADNGQTLFVPAMLSAFRHIETDELVAIQRTWLSPEGEKIDRRSLGPVKGACIKIDDDADVTTGLHIGEGFETCLTGRQLHLRPVWAAGSTSAIASFPVLSGIECLTILAEAGPASAAAVKECEARWLAAGREVLVAVPLGGVSDLNDTILEVR